VNFAILGSRGYPSTYSGYETLVRHLAPYIAEAGHSSTVYSRAEGGPTHARTWDVGGVRCIRTPGIESKSLSTLSFGLTSTIDALFRKFDAVLVLNIANGYWLPILRTAAPTAVNTDGLEWKRGKWNRVAQSVFHSGAKLSARYATTLVADSVVIGRIWRSEFDRDSTFIPYGAPVLSHVGDDELQQLGLAGRRFVLAVARLVPENNVDLMLDALERLADKDLIGVVVGTGVGGPPIETRLKTMAAEGRVIWPGHVSNQRLLDQLWANCAVYVHGHSVGGTNPSLLQAMGAGAPVVALNTPFNAEVIRNDAQLYESSADDLAAKIAAVLDSPSLREGLIAKGKKEVAERYSWDDVCRRYLDMLVELGTAR
jgi:glycosyltransferase involved in cell wall biosynthesis